MTKGKVSPQLQQLLSDPVLIANAVANHRIRLANQFRSSRIALRPAMELAVVSSLPPIQASGLADSLYSNSSSTLSVIAIVPKAVDLSRTRSAVR